MNSAMVHSISTPDLLQQETLPIVETFHSVQGEGSWCGASAFFIRLAGCDVGCPWCDTKISWSTKNHPRLTIAELVQAAQQARPQFVVITGGEPLMHDLNTLTIALQRAGLRIHLETSGAHPFSGQFDWVTLSPKRWKTPVADAYDHAQELKCVVGTPEDLLWAEAEAAKVSSTVVQYLQPEWNQPQSQALIFNYILQHSAWRMSLQTHKLLGVR